MVSGRGDGRLGDGTENTTAAGGGDDDDLSMPGSDADTKPRATTVDGDTVSCNAGDIRDARGCDGLASAPVSRMATAAHTQTRG
jgi:hypothetical protein